jgi:acetylornithine deacetylase/succinyl-diaminopimelate desuccinylase-like protein
VELLQTGYARQLRGRFHPLLRWPTVNVGLIQGGSQANIVPAQCVIKVDRRMVPGESSVRVCREVKVLLRKHGLWARVSLSSPALPCLPMETDLNLPLIQRLLALTGQPRPVGVDYFSDASVLSHGGIPAVLFGPGDIAQAHTANEWIALSSLERGTALLTAFLRSLP